MEPKLQRRVQRYGWDLAADDYEGLWRAQLEPAQAALLAMAALEPGQRVLDVACGTALVSLAATRSVGPSGSVLGVDLSGRMVAAARRRAVEQAVPNVAFERMDAETLTLPNASFDVVLCALGLMYAPDPERAVSEMLRVLRPGGRLIIAVWGERSRCGWAPVLEIVDAEVTSEVCPLLFRLGQAGVLARACVEAGLTLVEERRIRTTLAYASGDEACDAAFIGGPVALAWSHFDPSTRERARGLYLASIEPWRQGLEYRLPGEFVIVAAVAPG